MIRRFAVEMRLAPHSASASLAVRNAAHLTENGRPILESFASKAFENNGRDAPFLLDHDDVDRPIGFVRLVVDNGVWHEADAIIEVDDDDPRLPTILERLKPGAKVSPSFRTLAEDRLDDETGTDTVRIEKAKLLHVALLERSHVPGYPGAVVKRVIELDAKQPKRWRSSTIHTPSETLGRDVEPGEVIATDGPIIRNCVEILGIR